MLFLEIQQGEFINGRINHTSVHWKPTIIPAENTTEYVTLGSLYGKAQGFNLDDIFLPKGYYLTGSMINFIIIKIFFSIDRQSVKNLMKLFFFRN